jgi:SSS family transporter
VIGIDYLVLSLYMLAILAIGIIFAGKNKNSSEMFAAGGQSPWWTSGLSSFMTMFSAGTFVVWGGIAYKYGFVAIAINLCYGFSALAVGYWVAGRWKKLGIRSPAQWVQMRFGSGALHFYTWSMMLYRIVGVGVATYSLAVILVALMPLSEGNPLRDPATGNLSLEWAIILFGGIVVVYTMIGGLWAVLMTDVLQFIVLNMAVLFVVPLLLMNAGGLGEFIGAAPQGFFSFTGGGYTWFFLAGWTAIHFFMVGAEWAYVQRFICVRSPADARKSCYLFGALYLVSPFIWMLPPIVWRVLHPIPDGATDQQIKMIGEQAYIAACQSVLPPGMVGMMVAAMFSATASMVSGQLNVFAGVLTTDIYTALVRPSATESHLVWVGRVFTILLGVVLLGIALAIPHMGGAERVIVSITSLLVGSLLAPTVWGLFSPRMSRSSVFVTGCVGFVVGFVVQFVLGPGGWWSGVKALAGVNRLIAEQGKTVEIVIGVGLPVVILTVLQLMGPVMTAGWQKVQQFAAQEQAAPSHVITNRLPALVVAWSVGVCGVGMALLAWYDSQARVVLGIFAAAMVLLAVTIFAFVYRNPATMPQEVDHAQV